MIYSTDNSIVVFSLIISYLIITSYSFDRPFDLKKNLPLIAGICGAALITVILIGVIIYRLTRKENQHYNTPQHRPSCSIDEDLKNDINGHRVNGSTPNTALHNNSLNRRSGSKEWYV